MDRNSLELLLGQGLSVEEIGRRFGKHPSTVSHWMAKYGLEAVNREQRARGGIEREPLEALVEAGMTISELAVEFGLSKATVRHWLRKYGSAAGFYSACSNRATTRWIASWMVSRSRAS